MAQRRHGAVFNRTAHMIRRMAFPSSVPRLRNWSIGSRPESLSFWENHASIPAAESWARRPFSCALKIFAVSIEAEETSLFI